jgi:hypothetical protein
MRIFLATALLLVVTLSYGQFEDKKWIVGADIDQLNISDMTLYPNVAYAINSNTIIGVTGSGYFNTGDGELPDQNLLEEANLSQAYLSLFLKKYKNISNKWFLNLRVNGGVNWIDQSSLIRDTSLDQITDRFQRNQTSFSVNLSPGLAYQPVKWMIVEGNLGNLGYNKSKRETKYYSQGKTTYIDSSFSSSIGLYSIGVKLIL